MRNRPTSRIRFDVAFATRFEIAGGAASLLPSVVEPVYNLVKRLCND